MNLAAGRVLSINISRESQALFLPDSDDLTGINKVGVDGLVLFSGDEVIGDTVADRINHGGYNKAVYAYAQEDAQWWEAKIGKPISPGQFGENLTTKDVDISGALIGEQWRIGGLLLEVSEPRIPCRKFAGFWNRPALIREFTEANRSGAYLRIIEEGSIEKGAQIQVASRPSHGITIADVFAARSGARDKITAIAAVKELSEDYRDWAKRVSDSVSSSD
jgi:MOSC domain-containing protein YiiM